MTKLYQKLLRPEFSYDEMKKGIEQAKRVPLGNERETILRSIFSMIDLTSLNSTDSSVKNKGIC